MISLSIIIPAYNEEDRIERTLLHIFSLVQEDWFKDNIYIFEIIVVIDGNDKTEKICKKYNVKTIKNKIKQGKGYAIKLGVLAAQYDFILFMDADNSTTLNELRKFLFLTDKYDIIVGSRNLCTSKIYAYQPFLRVLSGKVFSFLVKKCIKTQIKDTQCGFKLLKSDIALKLFNMQTIYDWTFDVEMVKNAEKNGYTIKEIGIDWSNDNKSKLNLFKDGYKMLKNLYRIKYG